MRTDRDDRIAYLERRLAAELNRRLIAEQRAAELRRAIALLRAELERLQAPGQHATGE